MRDAFQEFVGRLAARDVRFVLIGVAGANYFAPEAGAVFTTRDRDLFVPPDAANLMRAWDACDEAGFELWSGDEPLDTPHDRVVADAVVAQKQGLGIRD